MKKFIFVMILLLLLVVGCGKSPTELTVEDSNEDGVYHIDSSDGLLGVVDLFIMPETIQGVGTTLYNGPVSNIGYVIFERDDLAKKIFGDSYIGAGDISPQAGTQWDFDKWYTIRLVIYESGIAGWVVVFLQSLGLDFFDSLQDYMIDEVYEVDVYLSSEGREGEIFQNMKIISWQEVTDEYKK
jgi:hypothetical protein